MHGEVPEVAVVPVGDEPLTVGLERSDEVGEGGELVVFPTEFAVGWGPHVVRLSRAELDAYIGRLVAARRRCDAEERGSLATTPLRCQGRPQN